MKAIIVDDDELTCSLLEECIHRSGVFEEPKSFLNAESAINHLKDNQVDLIFLDVEMPNINGFEMIQQLNSVPMLVIVSGKKDYAVEAFEYDVIDFLLKPFNFERFSKAASKAKEQFDLHNKIESTDQEFFIKKESKLIKIKMSEILYVEALADYVNIYVLPEGQSAVQRHTILSTMKSIEAKLPVNEFCRIHRSYIVRLDKISSFVDGSVTVVDRSFPVSRSNKEILVSKLKRF